MKKMAPPPFRFYIIFHKFITKVAYEELNHFYLEKYCRFFAVNGSIQKYVDETIYPLVIEERKLPNYNPFFQHNKFCETSVIYHTVMNADLLLDPYEFVGFLQYDMVLKNETFQRIEYILEKVENPEKKLFVFFCENSERHLNQGIMLQGWAQIIEIYNKMFSTTHILEDVLKVDIPLYHTYLVPKAILKKMVMFADKAITRIFELLNHDTHYLPYHIERSHGIFLALQTMDSHIDTWIMLSGIEHRNDLKDPWQEIEHAKRAKI